MLRSTLISFTGSWRVVAEWGLAMFSRLVRGLALLVAMAVTITGLPATGSARNVQAGPIWDNADARAKCPGVCGKHRWDGNWHTTVPGIMSVCSCTGKRQGTVTFGGWQPLTPTVAPGTSCRAKSTRSCAGCSVSCPPGQQASCNEGQDFGTSGSSVCRFPASCRCS